MSSDLELAKNVTLRPIENIAAGIGLSGKELELYGPYKAKISIEALNSLLQNKKKGRLIFVTAITPGKSGEGKTTVSIGLSQALCAKGFTAIAALREPSLGPLLGIKGGATGGGRSQALPMEDINLHFTGDLHAIAAANNLLAAMIDNHIFHGNRLEIDQDAVSFRRCLDLNDRALRQVMTGLGGKRNGSPLETGFDITAASEVMAVLCMSESVADLKRRLSEIVVGKNKKGQPVRAGELGAPGAMAVLLKDAIKPNLVQSSEGTPLLIHGGPFANLAHGCSSMIASRLALRLADYVVTEGGFASDLGFEKFCNIIAAQRPELQPDLVLIVVSIRTMKLHGKTGSESGSEVESKSESESESEAVQAISAGFANLERHVSIVESFGLPFVIAANRFEFDSDREIAFFLEECKKRGWDASSMTAYLEGSKGAAELAELVAEQSRRRILEFKTSYDYSLSIESKLEKLADTIYGADGIDLSSAAQEQLSWLNEHGFAQLPLCVAKTQYSLSDNASLTGAPVGFRMHVNSFRLSAGAGFIVAVMGNILTMPGLPEKPAALRMELADDGTVLSL